MLSTVNLTKRFGKRVLFDKITKTFDGGKRYGLIGANGAGKTTFLKMLSGELTEYDGEVQIKPGLKMGVLSQNQFAYEDFTLVDAVLYGNKRLYDAIKEKEKLYMEGDFEDDAVNERLAELEIMCAEEDPTYEYEVHIEKLLSALGFPVEQHMEPMSSITGGNKFKVLLAQVLYPKPDILLLDEPTNNLDMETIGWLENTLKRHEGTMIVISHDRHFLNAVVTHVLDLDFQTIREFSGTYDDWYIASTLIQRQNEADRSKKEKEKADLESFIRRFSANASKAKQATSRQKKLDKLDMGDMKISARRDPSIVFKQQRSIGNEALSLNHISHAYDDETKVYEDYSLVIETGDKIALIGGNGVGKTTLLEIAMQNLKPNEGTVVWGQTVFTSYFPQNTTELIQGDLKLYDWIQAENTKWDIDEIRQCLGRMLFNGEAQEKQVKDLSGGEKHRMMLSKMMMEEGNFIILDEPDNHLDLEAIVALGEALYNFPGNAICVSHDRELIDAFANRIIEIQADGTIVDFKGTYEEYKAK